MFHHLGFGLSTNLADLPYTTWKNLCIVLNSDSVWRSVAVALPRPASLRPETLDTFARSSDPSEKLLRHLANLGYSVKDFLVLLDRIRIVKPQLLLKRKFQSVRITKQPQLVLQQNSGISLSCEASGFPYPNYQWFCNQNPIAGATSPSIILSELNVEDELVILGCVVYTYYCRCPKCTQLGTYSCRVWNEISSGEPWSKHYRKTDKQFSSEIFSSPVHIESFPVGAESNCDSCKEERNLARVRDLMGDSEFVEEFSSLAFPVESSVSVKADISEETEELWAADKVALIISNSEYDNLPPLLTPPCDAEVLAEGLLSQGFKTVTLADLNLKEMKRIILEYKKLLGNGVYAVFYFVGHGFEAHGQCYLLPVDAPGKEYTPSDCLSVEWVLTQVQETDPALNLILLDMCRRFPPIDITVFVPTEPLQSRVKRNTVFGYATSFGVGAYEVRGETNGVFMKYLKNYLGLKRSVIDILNKVLKDLEMDSKASEVQFPELRSNLSRARSLTDPTLYDGHTVSFDHRTLAWQQMHELPDPARLIFDDKVRVTVWFDFCGHFTNMVYVYSSVTDACSEDQDQTETARKYTTNINFDQPLYSVRGIVYTDVEEGVSLRSLVKNLQKVQGELRCTVQLCSAEDEDKIVSEKVVNLGEVLITRLRFCQE